MLPCGLGWGRGLPGRQAWGILTLDTAFSPIEHVIRLELCIQIFVFKKDRFLSKYPRVILERTLMMNVMRLRLIADVIEAGKMPHVAKEAAALWGGNPESLRYIRSSSSYVFRFSQNAKGRILRLQHDQERNRKLIDAELHFILHVVNQGYRAALPIESLEGELIEEMHSDGHSFYATVFEAAEGRRLELEDLTASILRVWGRTLAQLHRASQTFTPKPGYRRPSWEDGQHFEVIDFDETMYHWYVIDIASSVEDIWHSPSPQRDHQLEWFIAGYQEVMERPEIHLQEFPRLYRASSLRKYARLLKSYQGADPNQDSPWLSALRKRHEDSMARLRESFETPFEW